MFKNWGTWFGIESENGQVNQEGESIVDVHEEKSQEINKPTAAAESEQSGAAEKDADPPQLLQAARGFSGYIYNVASRASKKLSESVAETAQTLKKSVEDGKVNGIIEKTILGDFQKEQEKFVKEKEAKKFGAAVPPWVGYNEEDTIQQQILALSADKRNFLRDPPAGVHFHFDFEQMYPIAMVMLEEDELLRKMRFHLVPKQVKEEVFWKNYFYRVSLIKQSAQLTALAAQQAAEQRDVEKTARSPEDPHQKAAVKGKTPPAICNTKPKSSEDEEEISTSPSVSEFVSDAFDSCKINEDDLRKEMEQLVLDKRENPSTQQEETADWERELQEELKEYDVLAGNENHDDNWDREIEDMLKEDS
ncbi:synapse-associated protein 1-like [Xiphias gladius]|uniref:synapse-associated protein 1-like n=1 Tax=Xiphias gladius TaxID=8245 RepID=UPI001A9A2351|nr:synapse-associated protein 1-like [Xiphias gladius]XP_039983895.1 synapse-associated protein 1-like [Xiphias gladius]XP_039983896.1 synapse-associated protein 1-like [Xiphias gladius]